MELRLLRYFLMVAQEENMTRAAARLHITQPTLSRQMAQLEEELGISLFEKNRHPLTLTEDGMFLRRRAQEILELTEKTERELSDREQEIAGQIDVGSGETRSMGYLSQQIAAFRQEHPQVRVHIYTGSADYTKERMDNGLLDFGLLTRPVEANKYESLEMPEKDCWCALVRRDSPLAEKEALTAKDLAKTSLILPYREDVRRELLRSLSLKEEKLEVAGTSNLEMNGATMVREGVGVFLCLAVTSIFDELCCVPIHPVIETSSVLAWKRDQTLSRTAAAFLEFIRKDLEQKSMQPEP